MIDLSLIVVAIITSLPPTAMALLAWRESRKTHLTINSRMDELLKSEKKASRAEGVLAGQLQENKKII